MKFTTLLLSIPILASAQQPIQPTGADGKPLDLGFESGTLAGWTATGSAFEKQPIKGDAVSKRRSDMKSGHVGQFWIGGFEIDQKDTATGTLTSAAFKASQPWASFLMAGGETAKTRVEIVTRDDAKVIHSTHSDQTEILRRSIVDLRKYAGREIFVRIVDEHQGHWGHVNFDDFVLYAEEPKIPAAMKVQTARAADTVAHAGLKPGEVPGGS